jgi:CubicO group peptidase (beta-lactamase class C family)
VTDGIEIHGHCNAGFEGVREAFACGFTDGVDAGASVAVMHRRQLVVDLWAGRAGSGPWTRDSLVTVFSASKGVAALVVAMLVDRGLLDYEAPVARYWPEFAAAGKQDVTVGHVLSHQAGLPVIDEPLRDGAAMDWQTLVGALERQPALWKPGSATGYHAVTFSWLVGELVRRATGRSLGAIVREDICEPLGVEWFIGAPASLDQRIAPVILPSASEASKLPSPDSLFARAMAVISPPVGPAVDTREFRAIELASTNGVTNARALATIYGVLAAGGAPLIEREVLARATAERCAGEDRVIGEPVRRAAGWQLPLAGGRSAWGRSPRAFGHSGAGGSLGFADPDAQIGFGFAMTKILVSMGADPRWPRLVAAIYRSLGD